MILKYELMTAGGQQVAVVEDGREGDPLQLRTPIIQWKDRFFHARDTKVKLDGQAAYICLYEAPLVVVPTPKRPTTNEAIYGKEIG